VTVFDTESRKHDLDEYFKKSADNVSFFFEKKAFKDGKLIKPKNHAINKIGHAMH
jgi:phytanoyl-CoA hydroxylase